MEIREASLSDTEDILEVQKQAFRSQAALYDDFTLPPLIQTLEELRAEFTRYTFLKAMSDGRIVGTVRAHLCGETCHIERLSVLPDFQNRGIGKRLMQAIEALFNGVRQYELFTGHKSAKNLALYEQLGYRRFSQKSQSEKVTLIHMRKERTRTA